jgi:Zn finger protein HypA/HybF involved in hydrogenase expression
LCIFREKPTLDVCYWFDNSLGNTGCIAELLKTDFPEITFENSPQEVEIRLVNSKNMTVECYDCHELINYTEDDIIEGWCVKCPCCGEEISILP